MEKLKAAVSPPPSNLKAPLKKSHIMMVPPPPSHAKKQNPSLLGLLQLKS